MLEIYFKEGLEAIQGKKIELKMDLEGPGHGYNRSDDEADYFPQHHGEIKGDVSKDDLYCHCNTESAAIIAAGAANLESDNPEEEDDCCCQYSAYNEDPGDDDGSYCQFSSDSEDDLYCQCSSNQTSSDEEGSPN
ncbi:hypothetical protein DID88_008692 [Monilinia fructigena]|uniref:Uncharacterized protein n=1 Tax=Monilinia fructigena TaxID=38457 RepID=A0A395J734_9HELO|nr:hypothetical protein DID88_008692 [Monilinia fructigena]